MFFPEEFWKTEAIIEMSMLFPIKPLENVGITSTASNNSMLDLFSSRNTNKQLYTYNFKKCQLFNIILKHFQLYTYILVEFWRRNLKPNINNVIDNNGTDPIR